MAAVGRFGRLALLCAAAAAMTCVAYGGPASAGPPKETKSIDPKEVFPDKSAAQLAVAAGSGDAARVDALVKAGANPSAIGDKGTSLLQWAMLKQSKPGMEALLNAGADVGHADGNGDTIMHYAAKATDPGYLDLLLAHKVDPNAVNTVSGATPLMAALMGENHVQFQKLLAAGAKPNISDRMGNTSLHIAAKINENQLALDLLKAGADPLARNKQNATFQRYLHMTPVRVLSEDARRQREAVMVWLREHNVPIEAPPTH